MGLFQPLDINGMAVPNRVMVPAMVRPARAARASERGFARRYDSQIRPCALLVEWM